MLKTLLFLFTLNLKFFTVTIPCQHKEVLFGDKKISPQRIPLCDLNPGKFKSQNINKDFRIFVLHEYDKKSADYKNPISDDDEFKFTIYAHGLITKDAWEKLTFNGGITKKDNCYILKYEIRGHYTTEEKLKDFPALKEYGVLESDFSEQLSIFISNLISAYEEARQ